MIRKFIIPANVFTREDMNKINSLIKNGPLAVEDMITINSLLEMRMEILQTKFKIFDEDYKRVADGHTGDFDYLCNISNRRAELYQQIEKLKKDILNNKEVIDHEERQS